MAIYGIKANFSDENQLFFELSPAFDSRVIYCVVDIEFASRILRSIELADMTYRGRQRRQCNLHVCFDSLV